MLAGAKHTEKLNAKYLNLPQEPFIIDKKGYWGSTMVQQLALPPHSSWFDAELQLFSVQGSTYCHHIDVGLFGFFGCPKNMSISVLDIQLPLGLNKSTGILPGVYP